jgi:hypothetical protein
MSEDNKDNGLIAGTIVLLIAFVAWGFTSWTRFFIMIAFFIFLWLLPGGETWVHARY